MLFFLARGCLAFFSSFAGPDHDVDGDHETHEEACPSRVAGRIPNDDRPVLVEAFETERHRIILCEASSGQVYYHGEVRDSAEEPVLMETERTSDGYVAWNGAYSYEISGSQVVVSNSSGELGRYTLTPWEDPA